MSVGGLTKTLRLAMVSSHRTGIESPLAVQAPTNHQSICHSPIRAPFSKKVAVNPPVRGEEENRWDDFARAADAVMVQKLPALPVTALSASTPRAYPDRTDKRVEQRNRHWHVGAYAVQSSRGTWLFPPNVHAGINN